MQILTVDVGTGTQDVFLYDSEVDIENGYKLIVPSPTMMVHRRIKEATRRGDAVLLTGVTMGGGPSHWAAEAHVQTGLRVYATPNAARSFNDELEAVGEMGIEVVSEEEAAKLPDSVNRIELKDFDFPVIQEAFSQFGVSLDDLAAVAVAVFDHGNAPPKYSDRQFRFDYLDERLQEANRLSAFAFLSEDVPPIMTRLQAVVDSAGEVDAPLVVMDTAPAAVLGASFDPTVREREQVIIANVGNFHTLAFRMGKSGIEGVFEHHTGLVDVPKLDHLIRSLAAGDLTHEEVFADHGHGALVKQNQPLIFPSSGFEVVVTGPRRNLMSASSLRTYFAAPFGDMMITGCFGLLSATADLLTELSEPIRASLGGGGGSGVAPWDAG